MRRVLIIHHLEPCWREAYVSYGTTFEEQAELVREHLEESEYDLVILTRFEECELGREYDCVGLTELIDKVENYGYGWEESMTTDGSFLDSQKWCEGGSHSEIVLIDDWMEELQGCKVDLCGAFDGECIEDMEIALEGAGVNFERLNALIV